MRPKKSYNVSNPPLFAHIPLKNVVIDNLHLFLRVSDVLFNLLVIELKRQDCIDKVKKFSSFDPTKCKHLDKYQDFVSSLKISDFRFYIGQTSKALKCRSLTGPEKLKVMSNISIRNLLPELPDDKLESIQRLWDQFLHLNAIFSKRPEDMTDSDVEMFEEEARSWGRHFINCYHISNVTPYIHAMMNHVPEFLRLYGSIVPFTQQGLEKYNDITTKIYFRSTNHQGTKSMVQIMEKQNRLEYLQDCGTACKKCFEISCSQCHKTGHNARTCTSC